MNAACVAAGLRTLFQLSCILSSTCRKSIGVVDVVSRGAVAIIHTNVTIASSVQELSSSKASLFVT